MMDLTAMFDWLPTAAALIEWQIKVTAMLAIVLGASIALRGAPSRVRRGLLSWGLFAAVVLPPLGALLGPSLSVEVPVAAVETAMPSLAVPALDAAANQATAATAHGVSPATAARASSWSWSSALVSVWFLGATFAALRVLGGMIGGAWLRRGSRPAPTRLRAIYRQASRTVGTYADVRLHSRPAVPIVLGLANPTILLPSNATQWSDETVRAVLLHELGHVAHRDPVWFPILATSRAVLWLNPLAWVALHRFHHEAEFAADDAAVHGGMSASDYAAELLALGRMPLQSLRAVPAPALGHPRLAKRIARVLQSPTVLIRLRTLVPVTLGAFGSLLTVMCMRSSTTPEPTPDENTFVKADVPSELPPAASDLALPVIPGNIATVAIEGRPRVSLTPHSLSVAMDGATAVVELPIRAGHIDEEAVQNHLIGAMYDRISAEQLASDTPIVLRVDGSIPWATVVNAAYTAGRAGVHRFYLAVDQQGAERAIDVSPPKFHMNGKTPGTATTASLPLALLVTWGDNDTRTLALRPNAMADSAGAIADWVAADARAQTLAPIAAEACTLAEGGAVDLVVQPRANVSFDDVIGTMVALDRACGGGITIQAGPG